MFTNPPTDEIRDLLRDSKTIAVVGISDRDNRASKYVSEYMMAQGYTIFPVNPNLNEWHGMHVYDSLNELPESPDIVNVFRRASTVVPVAEEAVAAQSKVFWLQQGIVNEEAGDIASSAGLSVVMDSCIMVEHRSMKLGF